MCRILKENKMEPSEKSDVSGKEENALSWNVNLRRKTERESESEPLTHSPSPLVPTDDLELFALPPVPVPNQSYTPRSP
jgi:hypothetical protein